MAVWLACGANRKGPGQRKKLQRPSSAQALDTGYDLLAVTVDPTCPHRSVVCSQRYSGIAVIYTHCPLLRVLGGAVVSGWWSNQRASTGWTGWVVAGPVGGVGGLLLGHRRMDVHYKGILIVCVALARCWVAGVGRCGCDSGAFGFFWLAKAAVRYIYRPVSLVNLWRSRLERRVFALPLIFVCMVRRQSGWPSLLAWPFSRFPCVVCKRGAVAEADLWGVVCGRVTRSCVAVPCLCPGVHRCTAENMQTRFPTCIVAVVLCLLQTGRSAVDPAERAALVDLYDATSLTSVGWTTHDGWDSSSDPSNDPCTDSWSGVGCSGTHVVYVLVPLISFWVCSAEHPQLMLRVVKRDTVPDSGVVSLSGPPPPLVYDLV